MPSTPKHKTETKENLHPRSLHRERYNFEMLIKSYPPLGAFVKPNQYNVVSIDFSDPEAVIAINKALIKHFYGVAHWDIPDGYLCPPIPGRADHIHYVADLLSEANGGAIPSGSKIKVLDIGTGASCIYPLLGNSIYGWQFVGTDVDAFTIKSATNIIASNAAVKSQVECRLQNNPADVFKGVIKPGEVFDLTICNPPFHSSWQEAHAGTTRKWENLNSSKVPKAVLNFGGKSNELWVKGGEASFINKMIEQSALYAKSVFWFSTLVSKKEMLDGIYKSLSWNKAFDVKTINMAQGQKSSRIVAWTFLSGVEQVNWRNTRWL